MDLLVLEMCKKRQCLLAYHVCLYVYWISESISERHSIYKQKESER